MELYKVKITLLTSSGYAVHIVQVTFVQRLSLRFSNFKVEQTLSEGVGVSSIVQHHIVTVHLHSTFIHVPGNQCVCVCPRITLNTNLRQTPTLGTEVPVVSSFGRDSLLVLSGVRREVLWRYFEAGQESYLSVWVTQPCEKEQLIWLLTGCCLPSLLRAKWLLCFLLYRRYHLTKLLHWLQRALKHTERHMKGYIFKMQVFPS